MEGRKERGRIVVVRVRGREGKEGEGRRGEGRGGEGRGTVRENLIVTRIDRERERAHEGKDEGTLFIQGH